MGKNKERKSDIKFANLSERFNTAATVVAAHVPYWAIMTAIMPAGEAVKTAAIIGGIFTALRVRYLREVPMLLSKLVLMPLIARKKSPAPEYIQSITDEFSEKAGYSYKLKTFVYEKGITKNAMCIGDRIYLGKGLVDGMNEEELRFVIGHELGHAKTNDISERYLFWPPMVNSFFLMVGGQLTFLSTLLGKQPEIPLHQAAFAAVLTGAYFTYQRALNGHASRICEYRADRNGVALAGSPEAAISALNKLESGLEPYFKDQTILRDDWGSDTKRGLWEKTVASHPRTKDRIQNIAKANDVTFDYEPIKLMPSNPS